MLQTDQLDRIANAEVHSYDLDGTLVDSFALIYRAFNCYTQENYRVGLSQAFVRRKIMPGILVSFMIITS